MENSLIVQLPTPTSLIEKAIEKGVDISQLKELMDLQERWEKKEARKQFFEALSKFQTIVPEIKKTKVANIPTKTGGSFSYKYANLGTISQGIKQALNECGLSYRWEFEEKNNKLIATCLVSHKGGHTEKTVMEGGKDSSGAKNDIQQTGSTQTYLQRYSLIGALGIATADDDVDGKSMNVKKQEQKPELSAEEIFEQWQQVISGARTQIELKNIYLKNRKVIDADAKIQELMKNRELAIKQQTTSTNSKVAMP